jgi:hypothetical protein
MRLTAEVFNLWRCPVSRIPCFANHFPDFFRIDPENMKIYLKFHLVLSRPFGSLAEHLELLRSLPALPSAPTHTSRKASCVYRSESSASNSALWL